MQKPLKIGFIYLPVEGASIKNKKHFMQTSQQTMEQLNNRIFKLHSEGMSIKDLAVKFCRKQEAIQKIIDNKGDASQFFSWAEMGDPFINGKVNQYTS